MTASFDADSAKALFRRVVGAGRGASMAVMVISFWVWLQTRKGCAGIIAGISGLDQEKMELATKEAESALSILNDGKEEKDNSAGGAMEVTQGLVPKFIPWSAIFRDKKVVGSEIKEVCEDLSKSGLFGNNVPNSSSSSSSSLRLNPNAKAWDPVADRPSEALRSLFLTFSNGYPLNERQISNFFNENFGRCVERVYVHWPEIRSASYRIPPLFGKVVFKTSYYPPFILAGHDEIRFMVHHKALWCKKFEPRRRSR